MNKLFYIMAGALNALNDGKTTHTSIKNHKTDLHTVPVILLEDALDANKRLLDVIRLITYEYKGEFFVEFHDFEDISDKIGEAIARAERLAKCQIR